MPGVWKMGVRARSGVFIRVNGDTGMGEVMGGGVEGGEEREIPFTCDGDVGSGICSGLTPGSCSGAGFGSSSRGTTLVP